MVTPCFFPISNCRCVGKVLIALSKFSVANTHQKRRVIAAGRNFGHCVGEFISVGGHSPPNPQEIIKYSIRAGTHRTNVTDGVLIAREVGPGGEIEDPRAVGKVGIRNSRPVATCTSRPKYRVDAST